MFHLIFLDEMYIAEFFRIVYFYGLKCGNIVHEMLSREVSIILYHDYIKYYWSVHFTNNFILS